MWTIVKKEERKVYAYQLGEESALEKELLTAKKIRKTEDGMYELFSSEAVNGTGEIAGKGDYFKVDAHGFPYPNKKEWFEANHKQIGENTYIQIPKPLNAWTCDLPECEEILWLKQTGKLNINEEDTQRYFHAVLYGAPLSAARDAVIVFYDVKRDENGAISEIDFCFVARDVFEKTYQIC